MAARRQRRAGVVIIVSLLVCGGPALALDGPLMPRNPDPFALPYGEDPSRRSVQETLQLRDHLRDQQLSSRTNSDRRMFRPRQPEPGYSELQPYSGSSDVPTRVRPLQPVLIP